MENKQENLTKELIIQRQEKYSEMSNYTKKEIINSMIRYAIVALSAIGAYFISDELKVDNPMWFHEKLQIFLENYSILSPAVIIIDFVINLIKKYKFKIKSNELKEILTIINTGETEKEIKKESKII